MSRTSMLSGIIRGRQRLVVPRETDIRRERYAQCGGRLGRPIEHSSAVVGTPILYGLHRRHARIYFREGQPAGPVIEGHADPIDDLLNDRVSLDTP